MSDIKYRQLINEKFRKSNDFIFHYWGYVGGGFVSPLGKNQGSDSYQFTGLTDKNGVDIYESDIVEFHAHYFNGNFDNDYIAEGVIELTEYLELHIKVTSRKMGSLDQDYFHVTDTTHFQEPCIEIIGNIHANPELLNEV